MSTNEVVSAQTQGQLVSTDFNRFEQFLESLGLPKENILATTAERQVVQTNFPQFVMTLPDEVKRESRYLSKFAAASAIGLFDAALNYVWNEVVLNLRKKTVIYGLELFFDAAVGGKHRDLFSTENDLSGIKDKVLLDNCAKLELISDSIYKKLTHILIMRNDIGASHPNDANINAFELMGWLQTCVQEVINDTPSEAALQVKAFVENLRNQTEVIDSSSLQHMQNGLKQLHTKNCDNVLQTIFGMYVGAGANNILKKNISLIAPTVWQHADNNLKYKLGVTLDGYRTNLHNDKFAAGNEFFEFCSGNQFKTLEARVILLDEHLDDLSSAHSGWDNFYNEVPHARKILSYISNEADIPNERKEKLIRIILSCRIGNGVSYNTGVSPSGKVVYDSILNMLGDDNIVQVLIALYRQDIYYLLSNSNCRNHAVQILTNLKTNVVSDKLKQILDHLISNGQTLEKTLKTTEFKTLASSHINFS
ncbi:hypothetical protein [Vibrio sp. Hep-1b-8]|uniref:hypothetical protein n=1 Tax=Vibrio sp. Hep-1b-8 TaxID=2144187 RepID=UPI001110A3B2|nr:hypothetical protein [Vibrio sp. Hep-1b-8]TMX38441.1 hypothetical protein DA100_09805 [Vibrio sp. Hep-1b-8]